MPKKVDLDQAGPAWHKWRAGGLGGSDAPVIMGDVKWTSPEELIENKLGLRATVENERMARGKRLEPEARRRYVERTGNEVQPCCVQHDTVSWLRVSLDGMSADGTLVVEIKCPSLYAHKKALAGYYPDYYKAQIFHQFLVAEPKLLHYASFCPDEGLSERDELAIIEVDPDPAYQRTLFQAMEVFQAKVAALKELGQGYEAPAKKKPVRKKRSKA